MPITPGSELRDSVGWIREMLPFFHASCDKDPNCVDQVCACICTCIYNILVPLRVLYLFHYLFIFILLKGLERVG